MSDNHTSDRTSTQIENTDSQERLVFTREELERRDFGNYISGLSDGESCFDLKRRKRKKNGYCVHARFSIALRSDDEEILIKIKNFFNVGNIYHVRNPSIGKPKTLYQVGKTGDLANVIIPHFDNHILRAKKRNDFLIWKEAVHLLDMVRKRKRTRRIGQGGVFFRWREGEDARFAILCDRLKKQREFESNGTIIYDKINIERTNEYTQTGFQFEN